MRGGFYRLLVGPRKLGQRLGWRSASPRQWCTSPGAGFLLAIAICRASAALRVRPQASLARDTTLPVSPPSLRALKRVAPQAAGWSGPVTRLMLITRRSQTETAPLLACSVLPNSVL